MVRDPGLASADTWKVVPFPVSLATVTVAPMLSARRERLMVNGRDDFRFLLDETKRPMFRLLGPKPGDKSHVLARGATAWRGSSSSIRPSTGSTAPRPVGGGKVAGSQASTRRLDGPRVLR